MRRLIWILFFLIASVFIGLTALKHHNSWMLIVAPPWTVQTPLWFAILCVVVLISICLFLSSTIRSIHFAWYRLWNWLRFRKRSRSFDQTQHGFLFLLEGRWKKAESLLMSSALHSPLPVINHICAAKAAHELKNFQLRDRYLKLAHDETPEAHLALAITEIEMKLSEKEYASAILLLQKKLKQHRKHPKLLQLLFIALRDHHQHALLIEYFPIFKYSQAIDSQQLTDLEWLCYINQIRAHQDDVSKIQALWQQAPDSIRTHSMVMHTYCSALFRDRNQHSEIEKLIRKYMKRHFDNDLVYLYAQLHSLSAPRKLVILGAWLKQYGQHAGLLLALGHTCAEAKLWGRAKEYFQSCLSTWETESFSSDFVLYLRTIREYGQLLEELSEHDKAKTLYGSELDKIIGKTYTTSQLK